MDFATTDNADAQSTPPPQAENADKQSPPPTATSNAEVQLTPPPGCETVTPDGGVLKHVLRAGTGEKPSLHSRCLVHYVGRLLPSGEVFLDTRADGHTQQPVTLVAGRDSSAREAGLTLALMHMATGERAAVYIQDPQYGYGKAGSFSFPAVPPNSRLVYDVELLSSEAVHDEEAEEDERAGGSRGLLFEEALERAERRRLKGNELFLAGKFQEALNTYAMALTYMDEDFMMQLEGHYLDKALEVKAPIHLNMAACQTRTKDYHTAIYNCSEVLKIDPASVKAMFRRGRARHLLGQTELALSDLQNAAQRAPKDAEVARELAAVRASIKKERQAEAELFRGAFGPPPPPTTDPLLPREGVAGSSGAEAGGTNGSRRGGTEGSGPGGLRQRSGSASAGAGGGSGGRGGVSGEDGGGGGAKKGRTWAGWLLGRS